METFEVENGHPAPELTTQRINRNFPFEKMKYGDSFFIPAADERQQGRVQAVVYTHWLNWRKKNKQKPKDHKMVTQKVEGGVRAWKVPLETAYKISERLPLPTEFIKKMYPYAKMKPGHSFLIRCTPDEVKKIRTGVINSSRKYRVDNDPGFAVRSMYMPKEKGLRVWRIN